ncbi:hypothetical protein [Corynebacterium sp. p3-SID1194]|uniref:hypothetical protein n=1 Tax=Corynebacterium sp. p3-SID1194 TaxID=2916105 RepID=UPI0021A6E13B|nr:hypothetical protein [Corynebacterium sp. p3-SID1194]MCT1450146.1 hypothetical protein [Corynebacterium sp. p3-SID1194]
MRHRITATATAAALALMSLTGCSSQAPLAEPELAAQSPAPSSETEQSEKPEQTEKPEQSEPSEQPEPSEESQSPTSSAPATPEESPEDPPAPEVGPNEVALEGTIKKLKLTDMVPPEARDSIQHYADQFDYDYYVIELDNPKPIEAPMGGAPITKTPKYAQLAMLSPGETIGSQFEWMVDVGRKVRVIGDLNQMYYGSDIATPPTAIVVRGSQHPPQFLD